MRILITGGAGFIGSHLVDHLLKDGNHKITVFDILEEQVHGTSKEPPSYLNENAEFILGSVTNYDKLKDLIVQNDVVFHLAAMVGVGQSMYKIKKYTKNNILGIGNLLDILVNEEHSIKKVVIASSNTVYGEGKYKCDKCGIVYPPLRSEKQLKIKAWKVKCPICSSEIKALLTDESTPFNPSSVYAFSKEAQCGIFASRLFSNKPPLIFEDGNQTRDFVHVSDICQGLNLAMKSNAATGEIFNIGTGNPISIKVVAEIITKKINSNIKPKISNSYRVGDIRHCVADISKIKSKLEYSPKVKFKDGIDTFIKWIQSQDFDNKSKSSKAMKELKEKNLIKE
ncbi:MAG: GDP-mannose 4,6-dehydratase [Candidatus Lokiarchaeota archaeon]